MDFQVITIDQSTGLITLGIPPVPKILTGMDKLIQIVVLAYFENSGRNVFEPVEGSGLRAAMGQFNYGVSGQVTSLAITRTKIVEKEIVARQSSYNGDPSERLVSLVVLSVAFDDATQDSLLSVQITNEAGATTDILI